MDTLLAVQGSSDVMVVESVAQLTTVEVPPQLTTVNQAVVIQQGGSSSSSTVVRITAQAISGHSVVGIDQAGLAIVASSDTPTVQPIGISTGAAASGQPVTIQLTGEVLEPSWNWDVTKPVFMGLNGVLTQVPPSTGVVVTVGYPTKPTGLLLDLDSVFIGA